MSLNPLIVTLGCGNGMMLVELARENYTQLTGIDYSPNAIELSKCIAADQDLNIEYKVLDLLDSANISAVLGDRQFDVVHDKGTYDAVSIHPDDPSSKRNAYINNVHKMTAVNGLLILTSCNWTEDELCSCLADKFVKYKSIPTPMFRFGGKTGSVVTQIVFKKVL